MFCGTGGSKSRLAKAAGAQPCGQMRDEKLHAVVARSTFPSQNAHSTPAPGSRTKLSHKTWSMFDFKHGIQTSSFHIWQIGRFWVSIYIYMPYLHDGIILYLPKESRSGRFLWIFLVPFPMPGTFEELDRKTFGYAGTLLFTWHQQIYVGKTVKSHQLSFFNPPMVCSVNPSSMVAYGTAKPISWNILVWFFPSKVEIRISWVWHLKLWIYILQY